MIVKKLKLQNFRKFEEFEIELDSPIVIIHAPNAEGKSTILEALHFLHNQSSPFSSEISDLVNNTQEREPFFRIEMEVEYLEDPKVFAIYQNGKTRQFFIDQHKTTRKKFQENLASTIFSPEQIELLMISPQRRRDFLNTLISQIDPDYEDMLKKMRKILKQRNAYLKKLAKRFYESGTIPAEDQQLDYWTDLYIEISSKVMKKRAQYAEYMQTDEFYLQYEPSVDLGDFSEMLEVDEIAKIHKEASNQARKKDIAMGHTTVGAHRDDWNIIAEKDIRRHGSRGEKRLSIGRVIIRSQDIYAKHHDRYPILLLDDISSELDDANTDLILKDDFLDRQQCIITTIRLEDIPERVKEKAKIVNLEDLLT
jgi:DNA replication and repair protein RecF